MTSRTITFDEYQAAAMETAIYPNQGFNLQYPSLGLCGESGEIANKVKKFERDQEGRVHQHQREDLAKEMGDVLWYLSALSTEIGVPLCEIANANIEKLAARKQAGTLKGDGDDR